MQYLNYIMFLFQAYMPLSLNAYTPLISSTDFDPVRTDVTTAAVGIISILLVVIGLGVLVRVLSR